jgi:hypothetical protein
MDYFDNGAFIENINDSPIRNSSGNKVIGWLIFAVVFTSSIAGFFIYKYRKSEKELEMNKRKAI